MPVQMIELEEVTMIETTDESLEVAGVVGGEFSQTGGITNGCCLI